MKAGEPLLSIRAKANELSDIRTAREFVKDRVFEMRLHYVSV